MNKIAEEQWQRPRSDLPLDYEGPTETPFVPFEDAWVERPIVERFNEIAARYGDKVAVADERTKLTYRELKKAISHLARRIEALEPPTGPVGIVLPNSAAFPLAALACLAVGRPYVPIDPQFPRARIDEIRQEAGISALIGDRMPEQDPDSWDVPYVEIDFKQCHDESQISGSPASGSPAIILYTSGSTGRPKGICNDQRAILQRVAQATNSCHLNANDRIFLLSGPGTIAGVRETFAALLNGASLYVADPTRLGINGVLRMLRDARATAGYTVPALLRQLLAAPEAREAFAHTRVMRIGGDIPVADDLALCRALLPSSCHILIAFSSTEVPTIFQWFVPRSWNPDGIRLPVGYARPGMNFKIEDDGVGDGAGELVVQSHYLALGYWQGGRLQTGPFQVDANDSTKRILRTGDRIRQRSDGLAEMTGRIDRQIKIRGLRVDLTEVESVLRGYKDVADAAVAARRHGEDVTALVAFVVPRDRSHGSLITDLRKTLAERLPGRMRPAQYYVLDSLPRLRGFKTDIQALEQLDQRNRTAPSGQPTEQYTPTEQTLLHLCRDIFQIPALDIHDNFFDGGADSLSTLTLLLEVERYWHVAITIADMFNAPTVTEFAKVIDQAAKRTDVPRVAVIQAGASPSPFFCLGAGPRYRELARLLGPEQTFLGPVHPRPSELSGAIKIEDVAAHFVKIIRNAQSQGPYFLGGWCIDGLVAYEVAQQLRREGETVALVVMFDTSFYSSWSTVYYGRIRNLILDTRQYLLALVRRSDRKVIASRLTEHLRILAEYGLDVISPDRFARQKRESGWMDVGIQRRAAEAYRPRHYDGRVLHLRRSAWQTQWTRARQDWSNLVRGGYETHEVPGDHVAMFEEPNVIQLAEKMGAALMYAQSTRDITETDLDKKKKQVSDLGLAYQ